MRKQRKRDPHPVLVAAIPAKESGRRAGLKSAALRAAEQERAAVAWKGAGQ